MRTVFVQPPGGPAVIAPRPASRSIAFSFDPSTLRRLRERGARIAVAKQTLRDGGAVVWAA
ncbi:MAG: hypothetical protein JO103_04940 [Candidatus Eremiobacteraeota bacterium]|nr:hypothetical protein [Candidatus Eremiobacteraeota bacterium]MBV9408003.1 hypothetical protein [Candidatus Eremiobacteraeota bacterium]